MQRPYFLVTAVFSLIAVLLLGGCGGGGGGSANLNAATRVAGPQSVSATALSMSDLASIGDIGAVILTGAESNTGRFQFSALAKRSLQWAQQSASPAVLSGALVTISSQVTACPSGGSATAQFDDLNANSLLDSGEAFFIDFVNCDDGGGVLNGRLEVTGSWTGDPSLASTDWSMNLSLKFVNLTAVDSVDSFRIDGTLVLTSSNVVQSNTETNSVTFDNLSITENGDSYTFGNFQAVSVLDTATGQESISVDGSIASSVDGNLVFKTLVPLVGQQNAAVPDTGKLEVTLADGSVITVTLSAGGSVLIAIDADGDGVVDLTENTNWATLESL